MTKKKWKTEWVGNEQIVAKLDVSTAACTYCGNPARVPEDVAAMIEAEGKQPFPVVVCPNCGDRFMADMGLTS